MSHSSKDAVFATVPTLDGLNYILWAQAMELYMLSRSLWQLVDGKVIKPSEAASSASAKVKVETQTKIDAWMEKNDAAKGIMLIKIRADLRVNLMKDDAPTIWANLKKAYGATSDSQIFSWFCEWYRFQIPGSQSPLKEFACWDLLVSKLKAVEYSTIIPLMVADINKKSLTVEGIKGYMLTEWERKQKPTKKAMANHISVVQQKGESPSFHQQQKGSKPSGSSSQQRTDQPQQQQEEKKRQRAGRGKGPKAKGKKSKGKGRAHVADADSDSVSDSASVDNMFASLSLEQRTAPAPSNFATTSSSQQKAEFALPFDVVPPMNSVDYDPAVAQSHYDAINWPSTPSHFDFPPLSASPAREPFTQPSIHHYGEIPAEQGFRVGLPTLCGGNSKTSSDPRPKPKQKATVTLINSSGIVSRSVTKSQPVQKKPTPPSIYPCMRKSHKAAEELGVVKTTETMKTLETVIMNSEEQMAPIDNAAFAKEMHVDEDDVVSISLEPSDRKRSRSLLPDPVISNKKPQLETVYEGDIEELFEEAEPAPVEKEGLLYPEGRTWKKIHKETGKLILSLWKESFWINGQLKLFWEEKQRNEHHGLMIRFNSDGQSELVAEEDWEIQLGGFVSPKEYITVEREDGLYLDFGTRPRTTPRKGYEWFYMANSQMWVQHWKKWEGTLSYDKDRSRQEDAESSIMGGDS
ncbi:hypothetical protein H1R20_g16067, partial [Candolleomyces eurysporus]